ncbi:haloacid dehalogenase type II [Marinithermus hydrothermalis]|uniref:Haloacid dehalogenase, type II n=1 Tax=Marinithermus hydrothermalis (strain DSM 14884 / JCM 11576 / T1) TaxID=869210 RepID=F2NP39_MARHT|nr:haloacid dehalogenase type II [Marinithermus hydrothermalis]AEB11627.1 haloacid dehalogenase, type II [Marinithermus hydrothermalis DSM 14884]
MRAVQAVVFDAYGTLFDPHALTPQLEVLYPGQGAALSELWRRKQLEYTWLLGLMGRYEDFERVTARALEYACAALGVRLEAEGLKALLETYRRLEAFPEVPAALRVLAEARPLAILSNGTPGMLEAGVRHAGLEGVFAHVLSVHAVRTYKPDPRVYRLAVGALALPPEAVLFVSANAWDVAGAKAFGFRTCWVNRRGAPREALGLDPDLEITGLDQLVHALG